MAETDNTNIVGKKIKPTPKEPQEIGIDVDNTVQLELLDSVATSSVDMSSIENLSNVSQTRESIFQLIDTMALDDRVSAILETYTEDVTQTNDNGQVVWCQSDNEDVAKYITHLLDVLNVDKHAPEWVYSMIKYGDVYLKMFKDSDYKEDEEWVNEHVKKDKTLNEDIVKEDINVILHQEDDHYRPYVQMVANPGEMFELTKHGKTMAYISAPTNVQTQFTNQETYNYMYYKMQQKDINIYSATDFVHGCLTNNNASRVPEQVSLFVDDKDYNNESATSAATFDVRRGQSLLYNQFRTWRQLNLLENSVLLNRLTKSAILRILNIDIGDMSKTQAMNYIDRLKSKIEQKTALQKDKSIQEYTNPGPIENIVYLPTHNGQGNVTAQTLGGDYDPKQLTDLEFFQDKFYGSMRVPKQFFNLTSDSTGFNGGTSLTIISSRYGKEIKSIQNNFIQMLTDLINLFLIDRGYPTYINQFKLRMQEPITQEELDRRESQRNKIGVIGDIMQQVGNVVEDQVIKLKIVKALLAECVTDPEVINLLQEEIDKLDSKENPKEEDENKSSESSERKPSRETSMNRSIDKEFGFEETPEEPVEEPTFEEEEPTEVDTSSESSYLPSPDELQLDLTSNQ